MKDKNSKPAAQTPFRRYGEWARGKLKLNINPGIASDAVYAMMAQDEAPLAAFIANPESAKASGLLPMKPPRRAP